MIETRAFSPQSMPVDPGQSNATSDASDASATTTLNALAALMQEMQGAPAAPETGAAQGKGSSVTNANGAPLLGSSPMEFSPDGLVLVLADAQQKISETQLKTTTLGIDADSKKKQAEAKKNIEKIKEWVTKFNEAAAKAKAGGILGWLKNIFTAVAAALAVVAAAMLTAATGGAAAPLLAVSTLMLASSLVTIASEIDKANGGKGFDDVLKWIDPGSLLGMGIGELAKKMGASDQDAAYVSMAVSVAVTIAIAVATVVLTGGAATGAAIDGVAKTILTAARIGQAVAGIASGATQIAKGANDIEVAGIKREAADVLADQKAIQALMAKLQHQIEEGREDLKKVMDALMESMTLVSQIINATDDSHTQVAANLSAKGPTI